MPAAEAWGLPVICYAAVQELGDKPHHSQVRALVLARSRAAAGRALAQAFDGSAESWTRTLATYGSTTGNPRELEACTVEGQVYVTSMNRTQAPIIPWPLSGDR